VGYAELLEQLKARVRSTQVRAARAANTEVLGLYWSIGRDILDRQDTAGWGTGVVEQLAADLRLEFPDQRGWSRRNLLYMRAFAEAWPDLEKDVPQPVAQLPWGHVRALLDRLEDRAERDWYAARAVEDGWSRAVLEFSIGSGLRARVGAAPSNFTAQLPPADSDLAQALVRDPYVFDTLGLAAPIAERDLEQALMDRLQATLLEFGRGMAFVGRQVRLDLGDGFEVVVDLVLFNVEQLRYVVVELKVGPLAPGDVGQLGVYVAVVDDLLRRSEVHAPTVGLLLVAGRSDPLAQYALAASAAPVAVADWASLPAETRAVLPPADRLAAALDTSTLRTSDSPGGES
jgi:predicted nuclease of restriction endonuclease-like (RecB) superfamily